MRKTQGGSSRANTVSRTSAARATTKKAVSPARGAKAKTAPKAEPEPIRGQRRACEAPNCNKKFPAYVARQRFCSDACRFRKFYWDYKNETGERYGARYEAARRTTGGKTAAKPASRTRAGAAASRKPAAKKAAKR